MADQPGLDLSGVCFQVALQCQDVAADAERLVVADRRARQPRGVDGDVKAVAVPMQHRYTAQRCQRGCFPLRGQRQRREADFLHAHAGDAGSQRAGNQLRTQADAEQRLAAFQPLGNDGQLVFDEGVDALIAGANGPAQHHQQISPRSVCGPQVAGSRIQIAHGVATCLKHRLQCAEVFKVKVPDGDGGLVHDEIPSVV